jgi:excisionase family DNA binding protein
MPHARIANVPIDDRVAFSLSEIAGMTGLSISGLYLLIRRGQLRSIRIGGRRLITRQALNELLLSGNVTPDPFAAIEREHDDGCARSRPEGYEGDRTK